MEFFIRRCLGVKQIQKAAIQGRGEEKEEEENALFLGGQEEQPQSLSCHEARSRLGLWHSPMQFVWGTCGQWGYQSIPVHGPVPPRAQALAVEQVTVSAAMHPGHPHGGNPTTHCHLTACCYRGPSAPFGSGWATGGQFLLGCRDFTF